MATTDLSHFLNPKQAVTLAKIRDSMKVADFGAGSGFFTRAAAHQVGPNGLVYAIDVNRGLLGRLDAMAILEGYTNIEYVCGDLETPHGSALPENSVDVVIISNLLFIAEHKDRIIEEAWRILHKGGRAIVIDWKDSFNNMGPHKDHVVTREDVIALAEKGGGFSYLEDIEAGDFHYGVILKKTGK